MANLTVAVVDDDPAVGRTIADWLAREPQDIIVSVFRSGEELLLSPEPFDIVYLDVHLEGQDGIETAKKLRTRSPNTLLIFVSGIRSYVFDALDVHPYHYLVKPLDKQQFVRVFRDACDALRRRTGRADHRLVIRTRQGTVCIPASEILYVERGPRRLSVHTKSGVHEMYGSLSRLEEELGSGFYRCHRAFLVNLACVRSYRADSIVLQHGEEVFLAKKKYGAFVKRYMWYLKESSDNG